MAIVKRLLGVYLTGVAMVVAVWFIINSFFVDSFDVLNVWRVLDVLMVIGLAVALVFNYDRKRTEDRNPGESITRRYLEFNTAFYLTAGLLILLLHNWLSLLALGSERSLGVGSEQGLNHQTWVIWAVVNTLIPLVLGVTGCAMWKSSSDR